MRRRKGKGEEEGDDGGRERKKRERERESPLTRKQPDSTLTLRHWVKLRHWKWLQYSSSLLPGEVKRVKGLVLVFVYFCLFK